MKQRKPWLYALIGIFAALSVALTTDQIMQAVYDSSHTALRVNLVSGGAPTPGPTLAPPTAVPTATPAFTPTPELSGLQTPKIPKASAANALTNSSMSDNGTNVICTEAILEADGTAAAPSYSFTNTPTIGMFNATANQLGLAAPAEIFFYVNGGYRFGVIAGGLMPVTDNVYDIGSSGLQVRTLYIGTSVKIGNVTQKFPKTFTATYNPASLAVLTERCETVTVTGLTTTGGAVSANPGGNPVTAGCTMESVRASATDTASFCWFNPIAVTTACQPYNGTWTFTQAQ